MLPASLGSLAVSIYVDHSGIDAGATMAIGKLEAFGRQLQMRGLSNILIGVSIALPLREAVREAAEFDKQMRYVDTVLLEGREYLKQYTEQIEQMSVKFGEGTGTLSKGLYDLLSAQIPAADAMNLLTESVKSARAGMTDTAVATDAMVSILNSYGLSAKYAADISDWMFTVVYRGTLTYEELASKIGFVATTASVAGVSIEEMGAAIATMTRVGLKADHAIVSLYNIIGEFLHPSQEAAETARQLGFEMSSATIRAIGLKGVFDKLKTLPPDTISRLFPNIRGLRGVLPAIQNMAGFEKDLEWMGKRAGMAGDAFKKMVENNPLYFLMNQAGQAIHFVARAIGKALAPEVILLSDLMVRISGPIARFVKAHRWIVVAVGTAATAMIASGLALISLGLAFRMTFIAINTAIKVWRGLSVVFSLVTSPIGLVILALAGVAAAIVAVVGHGDTFLDKLRDVGDRIWKWVLPAFQALGNMVKKVWAFLRPLWEGLKGVVAASFRATGEIIVAVMKHIYDWIKYYTDAIAIGWKSLWAWMGEYVGPSLRFTRDVIKDYLESMESLIKHWDITAEWAVTNWAYSFVSTTNKALYQARQLWIKYNEWGLKQQKIVQEVIATELAKMPYEGKTDQASKDAVAYLDRSLQKTVDGINANYDAKMARLLGPREEGELEKGLKARVAELEKQLGGAMAQDVLDRKAPELPKRQQEEAAKPKERVPFPGPGNPFGEQASQIAPKLDLARMAEKGSAEAYSIIAANQQDANKQTASNTKEMVKLQRKQVDYTRKMADNFPTPMDLDLEAIT
jgi:TP901 family phage tail tape measure protein